MKVKNVYRIIQLELSVDEFGYIAQLADCAIEGKVITEDIMKVAKSIKEIYDKYENDYIYDT